MAPRASFAKGEGGKMGSCGNFFENLCHSGTWLPRSDRRGGANMHQIDHGDRCVRLGKRRQDRRKCPWPKTRSAELGRKRQAKKPDLTEPLHSFGREPAFFIVLPGSRG